MLRNLRWRLTLLFTLVILTFIALVGIGGYLLLHHNYASTIDLSLQYRMALQFQFYGYTLPDDLQNAVIRWQEEQGPLLGSYTLNPEGSDHEKNEAEFEDDNPGLVQQSHDAHELVEGAYSSDLALIFVFPLDKSGGLLADPNPFVAPLEPNAEAYQAAHENGSDLRTITLESGDRIRLLTYYTPSTRNVAYIQLGRSMADQDQALRQLILGVSTLGAALLVFAAAGSWWLAGRSLGPAQRAWEQQQAFIANASHELRTPLTLIRASVEMALRGRLGKKERGLLSDVISESDYMSLLVDDLLTLSRLDSGRLQLDKQSVDLRDLITDIHRQAARLAGDHDFVPAADLPALHFQADPTRLRQVLLILLDNAFKHTPAGTRVALEVATAANELRFTVRDNGPGIPAKHLPHIFERFYQMDSSPSSSQRSNGLGLSIARGLAELHGGSLQISSSPQGAVFELKLPK